MVCFTYYVLCGNIRCLDVMVMTEFEFRSQVMICDKTILNVINDSDMRFWREQARKDEEIKNILISLRNKMRKKIQS